MRSSADVPLAAPSLLSSCAEFLAKPSELENIVARGIHLPLPVSHAIYMSLREDWFKLKWTRRDLLRHFCDARRFPLSSLDLSGADLDDSLFAQLLHAHQDNIVHLDIAFITGLTPGVNSLLDAKNIRFPQLKSLRCTSTELFCGVGRNRRGRKLGTAGVDTRSLPILDEEDLQLQSASIESLAWPSIQGIQGQRIEKGAMEEEGAPTPLTLRCPNVTELYLGRDPSLSRREMEDETQMESMNELLSRSLEPCTFLRYLDLSYWSRVEDLRALRAHSLTKLVLYDVPDLYKAIDTLCEMRELRLLDLSQCLRETGTYPKPATTLYRLVTCLPYLVHLDVSSTNLASQPSQNDWPQKNGSGIISSDIYALRFLKKKLEFLGLFNCDSASHYVHLPAERVSGDSSEDQVITALQIYAGRAGLLQAVLNESYQLYRFGNNNPLNRHTEALHLVLNAMRDHLTDSTLQIAGSASLFYIIRKVAMNRDTKKRVVSALLSGMEAHMEEQVMVRNCCLSLCQFEIPQEILFDYSRLAVLLVTVLQHHNTDSLTQRIVVFLLNSMACHVEGDQKVQVGTFGAIEMILDQIRRKLQAHVCDDVMEVGWSFLWNITDETPVNCERFLGADGLRLFEHCFASFRNERELVRNMMGLVGNIAEVDNLRRELMKDSYIEIFCTLLSLVDDSIEISYNSAGVLAHMASDGDEAWAAVTHDRQAVMDAIMKATSEWKLDTKRFINYRSFRPILRLLPKYDAKASQHWAVWALANLTTTDGPKYCPYVVEEGGETLLIALVEDQRTLDITRNLAQCVLRNILGWRSSPMECD